MRVSKWFLLAATTAATLPSGCGNDTVTVEHADVWSHRNGRLKTVTLESNGVVEATAIVGSGARAKRVAGRIGRSGTITFEDVSADSYVLELRYAANPLDTMDLPSVVQFPVHGADHVRIGSDHWAHPDGPLLDDADSVTLNLTAPAGLKDADVLDLVSLGSSFFAGFALDSTSTDFTNPPADGATTSSGFVVPAAFLDAHYGDDSRHLPSEARDDELTIVQTRRGPEFLGNDVSQPWRQASVARAIGVATLPKATLANGATNAITAALAAPATATVALDYRASTFNGRLHAPSPSTARTFTTLTFSQEVGDGPGYYASPAVASWSLSAIMRRAPTNPTCYPGPSGTCDPTCGACDTTLTGVITDPGDLRASIVLPTVYASGMRGVILAQYSVTDTFRHPTTGHAIPYGATATMSRPASALAGTLSLALPFPTNPELDGQSWSFDPMFVAPSETPTVTFEGPSADYFVVYVIELGPDEFDGARSSRDTRTVATLYTRSPSVVIPARVLQHDRFYALRISARREAIDFATPFVSRSDTYDATDIVTAPFTY